MLICPGCRKAWEKVGTSYLRKMGAKTDYYCRDCGNKRKPVEVEEESRKNFTEMSSRNFSQSLKQNLGKRPPKLDKLINKTPKNILLIGDLHLPFSLKGYLEFCAFIYNKYGCDHVIFMGDIIDNHFSSFHLTDPDGLSAADELDYAISEVQKWSNIFPEADVVHGNHDLILLRKAFKEGVSKRWIRDFNEVLGVKWNFQPSFEYNDCLFRHGIGAKAAPKAGSEMMNVIQSHFHTEAYIHYRVGRGKRVFGMQVPCGVDRESYALAYAKEFPKQAIGCAVLLEYGRLPIIEMMEL